MTAVEFHGETSLGQDSGTSDFSSVLFRPSVLLLRQRSVATSQKICNYPTRARTSSVFFLLRSQDIGLMDDWHGMANHVRVRKRCIILSFLAAFGSCQGNSFGKLVFGSKTHTHAHSAAKWSACYRSRGPIDY